jgi:tetratricopeptide (TPR) repeat protein
VRGTRASKHSLRALATAFHRRHSVLLVCSIIVILMSPATLFAQQTERVDSERIIGQVDLNVSTIEQDIHRLELEIDNPVTRSRYYPLEKRLLDARVHFELRNYAQAAILFMDAIENPQFRTHPDRWAVYFRLGRSLYELKNYDGARQYFSKLLVAGSGDYYQAGLQYLIEIGLDTRQSSGLANALSQAKQLSFRLPATQYTYGKGLYREGKLSEALNALSQIPQSAPEYGPAQYYVGVIYTHQLRLDLSTAAFKRVVAIPMEESNEKLNTIRELAFLSLGRLHIEQEKYQQAIDFYQQVNRHSKHFYMSLYEMSWAYVKQEEFNKALGTLDILLLAVDDEQLATRANILRGQLNIRLDQTEGAIETYNEIIKRFGPIRDELESFSQSADAVQSYFRWLLDRHSDVFQLNSVLSERAVKWLETDDDLKEVIALFDEMSKGRSDVKESQKILRALEDALSSPNRLEIFPKLKRRWTHISVAENQLISISQHILNAQGLFLRNSMTADERRRYDQLLAKRRAEERRFSRMPKSVADYKKRRKDVDQRFIALRRQVFAAEASLRQVRKQLQAMEKWLLEARYADQGRRLSRKEQQRYLRELKAEKQALRQVYEELTTATAQIDRENARVGVGDVVTTNETNIKNKLMASHRKQALLLAEVRVRIRGEQRRLTDRLQIYRERVVMMFHQLSRLLRRINRVADSEIANFRRQVSRERVLLMGYAKQVGRFTEDADQVADALGVSLFGMAKRRLSDVVLEADLGLIDVAWAKKDSESKKILAMQEARKDELDRLQETMEEILKD